MMHCGGQPLSSRPGCASLSLAAEFDGPVAPEGSRAGSPPRIGHVSYCDYVIWPRARVRGIVRIKATM